MKTLLVTGADGFVGGHLLPALRQRFPSANIIGTRHADGDPLLRLDITDVDAVRACVARVQPDACIHLAALASVDQSFLGPRAVWDVNLCGTLNLAEAILELSPGCRLVHASSGETYGLSLQTGTPVDEQTPLAPANPYAVAKAAADLALGEMALRGLRVIRLRLFNHTGPGQTENFVVPRFAAQVARIAAGKQAPVLHTGALDRWRDFVDVRDVVQAYLAAVSSPLPDLCVNICSGIPRRIGDVLDTLIAIAGIHAEVVERVSEVRSTDIHTSVGSPRLARETLGWEPRVPLDETLRALLDYWQKVVAAEPAAHPC